MKLPNGDRAIVPLDKLEGYCLNIEHEQGKHKARVFRRALNLGVEDSKILRQNLLDQAGAGDA
jgi:hypothetical protein